MRSARARCLAVASAAGLALAGCFELVVAEGAQITCSVDDPTCPEGLQCCEGRICQRQCACEGGAEPCGLNGAVDCTGLRQCADHCWAACPGCAERCADPQLRTCQADDLDGVWFCADSDVCVVKHGPAGTTPTAACHRPPPQCANPGDQVCACLQAPFSISPPCSPFEQCTDYSRPCVACRQEGALITDGGPGDRMVIPYDAGGTDSPPGPADAGAGVPDSSTVGVDVQSDAEGGVSGDASQSENPLRLGDAQPECYTVPGGGTQCCALVESAALFSDATGSYDCPAGAVFATECTAFDDSCAAAASLCNATDTCRWAYCYGGDVHCTEGGPPAPCDGTGWVCPAGSVVLSSCGDPCIE